MTVVTTRWIDAFGERLTLTQWARRTGIHIMTIHMRIARGWSAEKALATEGAGR